MRATAAGIVLGLAGLCWTITPSAEVAIPELRSAVTDLTDTFNTAARDALESKLTSFQQRAGAQVAVLIVPSTKPETIEQYAIRVADAWKLGRAEQDDGVLLLVAMGDRTCRIEVGRGLEGVLPDAVAKRIVAEILVPRLRTGDIAGGIDAAVDALLRGIKGQEIVSPPDGASSQWQELPAALGVAGQAQAAPGDEVRRQEFYISGGAGLLFTLVLTAVFVRSTRRWLGPALFAVLVSALGAPLFCLMVIPWLSGSVAFERVVPWALGVVFVAAWVVLHRSWKMISSAGIAGGDGSRWSIGSGNRYGGSSGSRSFGGGGGSFSGGGASGSW